MKKNEVHKDFYNLFNKKESEVLFGKSKINFIKLSGIFIITFLAIGFGQGSLNYLDKKMSDPFINWINVEIPWGHDNIHEMVNLLYSDELKNEYNYNFVSGYNRVFLYFYSNKEQGTFQAEGRTILPDAPLLDVIFSKENLIVGKRFGTENDIALIITKDFAKKFGIDSTSNFLKMSFPISKFEDIWIPLPYVAIVNKLPTNAQFLVTPYFYKQRKSNTNKPIFSPYNTKDLILFTLNSKVNSMDFSKDLNNFLRNDTAISKLDPFVSVGEDSTTIRSGYNVTISFYPMPNSEKIDSIFSVILSKQEFSEYSFERIYLFPTVSVDNIEDNFDYIEVNFTRLDKVNDFSEYFKKTYGIEIGMSLVKTRENFNLVAKLTNFLSILLIIFSLIMIIMFVNNVLSRHLDDISQNLGTFKAFGLPKAVLKRIYTTVILRFIGFSMVFSFLISSLIGYLGGMRLLLYLFRMPLEDGVIYFSLLTYFVLSVAILVFVISFVVVGHLTNKKLLNTPGDLIYKRK